MAEFKLGRIKFVYQGNWDTLTPYVVDDVVSIGGKTYICIVSHTSSALFDTDQQAPSKWNLVADGTEWQGEWTDETSYNNGALVVYGGTVYVCTEAHTSATYTSPDFLGLEEDLAKWDEFASAFSWKGEWATTTRYKVRDQVSYGGYVYVCNTKHISGSFLEDDTLNWDVFTAGIKYLGTWSGSSVRYKINDVVKNGASLYICTTVHTSSGSFDATKWSIFVNGLQYESIWSGATAYQIGDIVSYGGYTYVCTQNNSAQNPVTATAYWQLFTKGFDFKGAWSNATAYKVGDLIRLGGYTYIATADNTNQAPPNLTYWQQLNSGLKWNPTVGNYADVTSTNIVSATGDGLAEFDVVASGTTYTVTVVSSAKGTGYTNGDTLKILGTDVGGISPANDITLTVTGHTGGAINTVSATGISVTWATTTAYVLGDVVFFGASSYICIDAHVSDSGTRPDADTTGEYWNLLASGTEQAVLTTQGDMFFYGNNGPERLPVGTEGQILRVKNQLPTWTYYGLINNLVYVATTGIDSNEPGYGLTIDTPWKTVRFACEQIEKGYWYRNATLLLQKNKQFILKEVNNYIQDAYVGIDPVKTERDAGIVFDALVHDLSHGGTLDVTTAVRAYYNEAGTDYINSSVEAQITEFIAAQTYLLSLAQTVISNQAPAVNYQTLNGVVVQAEQIIDLTLVAEDPASDTISSLMSIVINGLAFGSSAGIAAAIQPNTTISIKTGSYDEILPIVIPRSTALVGDELRSTIVQPRRAIASLVNDKPKTISALTRIKAVIPDLISNTTITATTGNTQTQVTTLPDGDIGSTTATTRVGTNADIISTIVEDGIGSLPSFVLPTLTGYNTSFLAGYGDGKAQLVANYAFIKDEIAEYLDANYNDLWTSLTVDQQNACKRDVGYILDALQYDMTYGGNLQSLIAGSSYYSFSRLVIGSNELIATQAAYEHLKDVVGYVVTENTSWVKNTALSQDVAGTAGSAGASTFAQARVQDIIDWITDGVAPTTVEPTAAIALASDELQTAFTALQTAKAEIQSDTVVWVKKFYQNMYFNEDTCYRDSGLIVDALSYDTLFGSNFNSIIAGMSYYRVPAAVVLADQLAAELGSITFIKHKASIIASSGAVAQISSLIDNIVSYITTPANSEVHGSLTYNNTLGTINGVEILRANKDFLSYEATAWITEGYGGIVTTTTSATNLFELGSAHNFVAGDPVAFSGTNYSGSGIELTTTYYVLAAGLTSTEFSVSETVGGPAVDITSDGSGSTLVVRYGYNEALCRRDMAEYIEAMMYDLQYVGNYKSLRAAELYVNAVNGSTTSNMYLVSNGSGLRNMTLAGLAGTLTAENSFGTKRPTAGAYVSLNPGFGPNDSKVWVNTRSHYSQNVTMFGSACTGAKIDAALHAGGNKSMVKNDFTTILSDGIGVWCTGSGSLTELVSVFNYYGYAGYLAELGGRIRATNGNSSYGTYGVIAEGTDTFETPIYATLDNRANDAYITNVITDGINQILRVEYANAGEGYSNATPAINGSGYNAAAIQDEFRDGAVFETRIIDPVGASEEGGTSYITAANTAQEGSPTSITIAATDTALTNSYNSMRVQVVAGTGVGQYGNILTYANGTKIAQVYKDSFTTLTVTASTTTGDTLTVSSTATLYANMPIILGSTIDTVLANTVYYVKTITNGTTFTISETSGGATFAIDNDTSGQTVTLYAAGWDHVVPGTEIEPVLDLTSGYIIEPRISYTAPGYKATARTIGTTSATWKAVAYGASKYLAIANGSTTTAYSGDGKTWTTGGALTASTFVDVVYGGGEDATATAVIGGLGGSGAVLEAVIGTGASSGQIVSVTIVNGGYNYTTVPVITFEGGGGAGAEFTATILNGAIASVDVVINGSGYTSLPTVNVVTSQLTTITPIAWGRNYFSTPTVTVAPPYSATAWTSGGSATSGTYYSYLGNFYRATSNGTFTTTGPTHTTGSTTNGTVTLLYVGTQATATANRTNAGVSSFTITEPGFGYVTIPSVTILDTAAKFVGIRSGASATSAYTSVANVGSSWTAGNTLASKTDLVALAYGNGTYVAVGGTSGTASAVSSTDGITWIDRSSAITALSSGNYSAVAYGNGIFVAIQTGAGKTSYSANGVSWTEGGSLPSATTYTSITYGNGRFVALAVSGAVAYSIDNGTTWTIAPSATGTSGSILSSSYTWTQVRYGQGLFIAMANGSVWAQSSDGINWATTSAPSSSNWAALVFGNVSGNPLWVSVSSTSGTVGASIHTGAKSDGRVKVVANVITEIRMIEPGSGYPKGIVTATTGSTTDTITVDNTENLIDSQPVEFTGLDAYGLTANVTYYVIGSSIVTDTSFQVSAAAGSSTPVDLTTGTDLSGTYTAGPIATVIDPNHVIDVATRVRTGNGVLGNPSFTNRGSNNATATASVSGDGYADIYQNTQYVNVAGLYSIPTAGANVTFTSITGDNSWYKLVSITNVLGVKGNYTATFQVNPALTTLLAPAHNDAITTRLAYSQVRLTGHDFLYIGTGNQSDTNYPYVDPTNAIQSNQQLSKAGGRVFFTSTDQDGNFNVGNLFGVQQATGTATLNASAFNLAGLQSLQLGAVTLGVGSAVITQFSTDPYFTANSDNVVPTQRAIKAFITSQIGGGQSSLNVNTLTAGQIYIAGDTITNTSGAAIYVTSKMTFTGGIDGAPVALAYFGQR